MSFVTKVGVVAVALAASTIACAEGYVVGSIGRSDIGINKADLDGALTSAGATAVSSTVNNNDTGYKVQLGYQINPNFAVEGGYVDLGKASYSATFTGGSANASVKAAGLNIAALGILPINDSVSLFGKLGFIDAKVTANVSATGPGGTASASASSTKWKTNYGVGGTYNVSKQVGIRVEYEQFSKLGDSNSTGTSNVNLLSAGVVFKF